MSFPLNTPNSHWPQFSQWLNQQNLREGQDYTLHPQDDQWTIVDFARHEDHWAFAVFAGQFNYS